MFSAPHIGRIGGKGLCASLSVTSILFLPQGTAIRTLHYSQRGNKEQYIGQIRRALVHQAIPRGRDLQRGTSCFKANLICSCSRIQARKNHPKIWAFCWPLGAFEVKVSEVSSYCIAITQFYHLSCFRSPLLYSAPVTTTLGEFTIDLFRDDWNLSLLGLYA